MNEDAEIDIFRCLNFIRDQARPYGQAKATRIFLEEFRKSKKAVLMREAEQAGHKAAVTQEREAYQHPDYQELLAGLRAAVEEEETLRWQLIAAQAKISAWQTIEATRRVEAKTL